MSFKEQLRNHLVGLWRDFWFVPPRQLLPVLGYAIWGIGLLLWRVQTVFTYPAWFHTLSSLLHLVFLGLFGYTLYRKARTFYNEKMR